MRAKAQLLLSRMISLFHESKQTGILLREIFKGKHLWVPPIEKQIEDAKKAGLSQDVIDSRCV